MRWLCLVALVGLSQCLDLEPQLNGAHFKITALQENGFLDMDDDDNNTIIFSGYLIDMLEAISQPHRANFTYDLLPPSGYGSLCVPRSAWNQTNATTTDQGTAIYRTQYNCGASDVNDGNTSYRTDMYLGMYYITPSRQRVNQFTIPFLPPFSGTPAMYGTATSIASFEDLVDQQRLGLQDVACAPGGTALLKFAEEAFPGLRIKGVFGDEDDIYRSFVDGTCSVYIVDKPLAAQFVLRRFQQDECLANGKPIGVIGEPMSFGLSHYAIGIRGDLPREITDTISYWMNVLMICNPLDKDGPCPDGNLASFFDGQGGTGSECGYVLYPADDDNLDAGAIAGIVVAAVVVVIVIYTIWHIYRLKKQRRKFRKKSKLAEEQAAHERELNEFIAHEVRNPLASAIAALSFVRSKASNPQLIPSSKSRASIKSDIDVVDSSMQFVSELLRNMLDLQRSSTMEMKLHVAPTDILKDVFEPVTAILFMRGAKVDVITECPKNLIVLTDRMRLKQIFLNLANNATKFVETGYIRLRAEVKNDNVCMYVEDSGPGIPAHKRGFLFAKFQESLDQLNQGTGIGLCVCKNLSKLMGADLFHDDSFDSGIPGCPGTRFTLLLNQKPLQLDSCLSQENESEKLVNGDRDLPEALNVLFVDDDMMIRKMFSRTLRTVAPDWNILESSNGETALRHVDEQEFDLIFMDQHMASIEKQLLGTETVRLLRSKGVRSVICGLSANDKEEEFLEAGANAFLLKPFPCQKDALKRELLALLNMAAPKNGDMENESNGRTDM